MNTTIQNIIMELLQRYKKCFLKTALSDDNADELYKWQLITDCHEKSDAEIIRNFKNKNIVDAPRVNIVLSRLLETDNQQLVNCFQILKNEDISLSERLSLFKKAMDGLCGDRFKVKANDERTAAAFLACWNPEKYTFFKDEIYQNYCSYIGEKPRAAGEKYPHYLQLIAELAEIIKQDHELNEKYLSETKGLLQSDLLVAQNILWQMKDMMNMKEDKYTNFKHHLEYFVSHLEWCNKKDPSFIGYNNYIKPLINANKFKLAGQGWDGDQIQEQIEQWAHYEKYTICISIDARRGYQSNACYLNWEGTWINVRPLWDNDHIVKLYLSKEEKSSAKEERIKTIQELGLFDNKEPNSSIKTFFDEYERMILEYDGTYYNKWKMEQLQTLTQILALKKNIILQGAPGTGKTYNTAVLALSICNVTDIDFNDHKAVMKQYEHMRYDKEKNPNGQIGFCTFHQSMDYEDFVEGIKPKTENGHISYDYEDGIFKKMVVFSKYAFVDNQKKSIVAFKDFDERWNCLIDSINENKTNEFETKKTKMTVLDVTDNSIKLQGESAVKATTCYKNELEKLWNVFGERNLEEIKNFNNEFRKYVGGNETAKYAILKALQKVEIDSCYIQEDDQLIYDKKKELVSKLNDEDFKTVPNKNFVLIIDEINRGNVSKIFGELITLLEADKRLGGDHPIKVTLPYSKESFGVPSNLYIIGTMNTTDRSVGTIDYAVRRRFAFVTLESKKEVIEEHYKNDEVLKSKALALFEAIEAFLKKHKFEMDFEDLMVGHSYFMAKDENELDLKWKYEIVPLLREYYKDGIINQDVKADITIEDFCISK